MKKLFVLMITLCMLLVLTACTTKKENKGGNDTPINNAEKKDVPKQNIQYLTCNKDYSAQMSNGVSMDQDVEIRFVDNKVDTMVMSMNFELPSAYASAYDTFVNSMKTTYDNQYGKYNGVTITVEKESSTEFSIVITMDFSKMTDTDKKAVGMSGSEDYTVNKTAFINQGYTCKEGVTY